MFNGFGGGSSGFSGFGSVPLERQTNLNEFGISRQIIPSYGISVVPYGDLTGLGGDVHDSFKLDRYDNIYGGHTTLNIRGYEKDKMDW